MYAVNKKNKLDAIICDKLPRGYVEILEEEYLEITQSEAEISTMGAKNFSYKGYGSGVQQTFVINANNGSASFASGAMVIDAGGTILANAITANNNIATKNPEAGVGILAANQTNWIALLAKSGLSFTNGNSYPATGRPSFNSSAGATLADLNNGTVDTVFNSCITNNNIATKNPDSAVGIQASDQKSWIVLLQKSALTFVGGNVYTATGRPSFNASQGATLADLTAYQPKLAYTPVQQGTGIDQITNVVKIGWSAVSRIKVTIDNTDMGNVVTDGVLNNGTLPASFKGQLALNTSGAVYVTGTGDTNGYAFSSTTPNGIYAPNGTSQFGALHATGMITADKGIAYPNVPNVANMFSMAFGYDGTRVRYMVDNNPAASGILATAPSVAAKIAAVNFSVDGFGACYVTAEADYFTRTVKITLTALQAGGGGQTAAQNIAALASALGVPAPSILPIVINNKARFCHIMAWGANLGNWDSTNTTSGTTMANFTWNMTKQCSIQDGARYMGFEYSLAYQF